MNKWIKRKLCIGVAIAMTITSIAGCNSVKSGKNSVDSAAQKTETSSEKSDDSKKAEAPQIDGLTYESAMNLTYAQEFDVFYYKDGYKLIDVHEGRQYLIVPEGKEAPEGLDSDIVVINQPVQNIYMAATAIMSLFDALDAIDTVKFSGLEASGWYIESAKKAMESGAMTFAGKYSEPDYEKIVDGDCKLAVESTMILHSPKVQEMIEDLDIPVFVDYSSYESHPLGRTEWVKLYGLLTGQQEAAESAFNAEKQAFESVSGAQPTGKTVAFFYITTNGEANVRRPSDYLAKMIEMAGGTYILEQDPDDESKSSTMSMEMEAFYAQAKDADYIIYNSTVDGELKSRDELLTKSQLLENFKAVQNGNVYCTTQNIYQSTMELGTIIADIHNMLQGDDQSLTYIYKLE